MCGLAREVPPRVCAAVLRTLCNGWATARRFLRFQSSGHCFLGCQNGADSIEHYAQCSHFADFCARHIGTPAAAPAQRLEVFLTLTPTFYPETAVIVVKRALALYAIYTAHAACRHSPMAPAAAREALVQRLREAVRGHPRAAAPLRAAWQ